MVNMVNGYTWYHGYQLVERGVAVGKLTALVDRGDSAVTVSACQIPCPLTWVSQDVRSWSKERPSSSTKKG